MTQRHRTFSSKPKVQTPVTFELDGEDFEARAAIPGAKLLDFIADADSDDGGRASQALIDFMESVIIKDHQERFRALIRDEDRPIEIELLAEICEWLVGEYASRPTESPSARFDTPSATGLGSTETASSVA